jgi:hypothetical protein
MEAVSVRDQIISQIDRLTPEQQQQALNYVSSLTLPRGETGKHLIESLKHIHFDPEDLEEMRKAIEEEFETVDLDDWDKPIFPD